MKVERVDLYDFKLTLTQAEFKDITEITDFDKTPLDIVLCNVIEMGFDVLRHGKAETE